MSADTLTMNQVRVRGLAALKREIGAVGMIRFLQQFDAGSGDYSKSRHEHLDGLTVDDIAVELKEQRSGEKQ